MRLQMYVRCRQLETRRCSHGPVGRPDIRNSNAELDRPQAGGYNISSRGQKKRPRVFSQALLIS